MEPRSAPADVIDDAMAEIGCRKTRAQRLQIVDALYLAARSLVEGNVRATHPTWDDKEVATAVAARIAGDTH